MRQNIIMIKDMKDGEDDAEENSSPALSRRAADVKADTKSD